VLSLSLSFFSLRSSANTKLGPVVVARFPTDFCIGEYHAVNQIVAKGLHNGDDEAFEFTKGLIERLETTKAERADDDAIIDNTAGQAYVEQFAQETFARAERTMRANKVTR
jgi:hypothetical protein